jgi:hypothetical protein
VAAAALVAKLDLAGGRAAVVWDSVSIITLLGRDLDSVATAGDLMTGLSGRDAGVARLYRAAVGGTAIVRHSVVVVAGLVFGENAITTASRARAQVGIGQG